MRGLSSVSERATSGSVQAAHVGLYGMARRGAWYVSANVQYARGENDTTRVIMGVGPTEIARGKLATDQLATRVDRALTTGRRVLDVGDGVLGLVQVVRDPHAHLAAGSDDRDGVLLAHGVLLR